ncbi:hypothetical protein GCM10011594_38290 [Nakamurella endophytica]|uniref:Uncharacterized protein n=1 Tax=Nakamurella endophytica TaxID=1748367 RepID=A0A917TBJ4_9ACTN|nr:hypothetical protein GCM10011594_38290 [Nakamurella endophytica]
MDEDAGVDDGVVADDGEVPDEATAGEEAGAEDAADEETVTDAEDAVDDDAVVVAAPLSWVHPETRPRTAAVASAAAARRPGRRADLVRPACTATPAPSTSLYQSRTAPG